VLATPNIREARRDELSQIVTLYNLMWMDSVNPIDLKVAQNVFDQMQLNRQWMFVVEMDDRVVASFMMLIADSNEPECVLDNVVVHPRYQRKGIGRMIVMFVAEHSKNRGCRRIVGSIREKHELSSAFWESMGFERRPGGFFKNIE